MTKLTPTVWIAICTSVNPPPPGALPAVFCASAQCYMWRAVINNGIVSLFIEALLTNSDPIWEYPGVICHWHESEFGDHAAVLSDTQRDQEACLLICIGGRLCTTPVRRRTNGNHIAEWILNDDNWFRFRCARGSNGTPPLGREVRYMC